MTYHLDIYGNRGTIRNDAGETVYYGDLPLCRKALADWTASPPSPAQERKLIAAQARRTSNTWTRLLGGGR
jgi:hypothetical protein